MSHSARRWDEAHAVEGNALPSQLYTDENPATTIKGTGFKNRRIAERTIELTGQPGARYKQYWTVKAMRERAMHHPHPTEGMREAIAVFDEWLSRYKEPTEEEKKEQREEWEEFRRLCQSDANQHAYGKDLSREELKRARNDISDGNRLLFDLLCRPNKESACFHFPLTSFVAVFGGPGLHGYGKHKIDTEQSTSMVDIEGMDGVEELLGSAKAQKLSLASSAKIRVSYHRKQQKASALIEIGNGRTLESLWRKTAEANETPNNNKRKRREENGVPCESTGADGEAWTCSDCTFIHSGKRLDYLACEICGALRKDS